MEKTPLQKNAKTISIVVVLLIIIFWLVGGYNGFVSKSAAIDNQWAQVENQLQRRFDLIPNLESTVKGVTKQEKDVFGAIADARTRYSGAVTVDEKAKAAGAYESAIGRLLLITENYPVLQSSAAFRDLMVALEGTENRLSVERMKFNDFIKVYDVSLKSFPSNIVAKIFNFGPREYFEVAEVAKENPKVDFTQ
ncbi:MAG: LemA family protein [Patescibacteria group bacterium]